MAIPWLFFIGFVIVYAAMFSKLWRVNRVLQFRRQKRIQAHQVLGPFAVLLIAVIAVLTVWTIVDPLKWHRELIEELPPETYGQCGSDKFVAFSVPLCVIALVTMGMAAVMAFRTKHLPGDFSEWSWIFYAIFVQLQTFIGKRGHHECNRGIGLY
jgi:gamma-aminobutyric acid type B receptor